MNANIDVPILEKQAQQKTISDFLFGFSLPGRIIVTLYTFHGLFFIYSLVIQYIILIPSFLYTIEMGKFLKCFLSFVYLIFAISSSNILVIPTFEFLSFPFLLIKNPFSHFISFIYINRGKEFEEKKITDKDCIVNIILIVFEIIYFISLICGYALNIIIIKDIVKMTIIIIIYLYYLTIVLLYFFTSFFLFLRNIKGFNWRKAIDLFYNKTEIPDVNLMSYLIHPFLFKFYKKNNVPYQDRTYHFEDFVYDCGIIIKLLLILFSIVAFTFILKKILGFSIFIISFILFFFIMTILSIGLNFPFCYRNRKTFGTFGHCLKNENNFFFTSVEYTYRRLHSHSQIISITRFICDIIILLVAIALLYIHFFHDDNNDINGEIFSRIYPVDKKIDTKKLLLPNICYSSVHNIPLPLYLPFINDAYYYNNIKMKDEGDEEDKKYASSLEIEKYRKLFFDNDYTIDIYGNLIKEEENNNVKMVQYNVRNKKNYITILSIKGTSYNKDIYLDMQLYFSTILLNFLSTFSVLSEKNSFYFKLVEYSLNIPYRLFFRYLIIDKYIKRLQDAYIDNEKYFFNNVVLVGHSLGGGLAKLFGRIIGKQAISLSGPGINSFHSLWNYKGKSENFGISAIDLVPDKDLVPRVEVSGGTVYRIICKEGVLNCHSKDNSLCEVLIMCRNPNYKSYCKNVAHFTDERIQEIIESSELNNNIE